MPESIVQTAPKFKMAHTCNTEMAEVSSSNADACRLLLHPPRKTWKFVEVQIITSQYYQMVNEFCCQQLERQDVPSIKVASRNL